MSITVTFKGENWPAIAEQLREALEWLDLDIALDAVPAKIPTSVDIVETIAPSEPEPAKPEPVKAPPKKPSASFGKKAPPSPPAASPAASAPAPDPEPQPLTPAALIDLRAKTLAELQAAYANGKQTVVFKLLADYGNGAKSFRELQLEDFPPLRRAIDAGALA